MDLTARAGGGLHFAPTSGGTLDTGRTFYAAQVLVEPDRVLLWGWAWEGADRTAEEITAASWCGTLTSPRELVLVDGAVVSRPAAELTGLRQETINYQPGDPVALSAYEVNARNGLRLRLVEAGGRERVVTQTDGPARLLVDGSLVEVFGSGPSPHGPTSTPTSIGWSIRSDRSTCGGSGSTVRTRRRTGHLRCRTGHRIDLKLRLDGRVQPSTGWTRPLARPQPPR